MQSGVEKQEGMYLFSVCVAFFVAALFFFIEGAASISARGALN